jgi:hypothetical protein
MIAKLPAPLSDEERHPIENVRRLPAQVKQSLLANAEHAARQAEARRARGQNRNPVDKSPQAR